MLGMYLYREIRKQYICVSIQTNLIEYRSTDPNLCQRSVPLKNFGIINIYTVTKGYLASILCIQVFVCVLCVLQQKTQKYTVNYEETCHILNRYVELGGNFIDTANMYCVGQSEQFIGNWLSRQFLMFSCLYREASRKRKKLRMTCEEDQIKPQCSLPFRGFSLICRCPPTPLSAFLVCPMPPLANPLLTPITP